MKNEHDESVIEWFPLKNGNIMVRIKDKEGVDDEGISKKVNSQSFHLRLVNIIALEKTNE